MSSLPSTIKAIGIQKIGDLDVIQELTDLPFPEQKDNEILVKVEYGGVNFVDVYERTGLYPASKFPKVLGNEAGGTLVRLPSAPEVLNDSEYKLRGFREGAKVGVLLGGSFAEYVSVPWKTVVTLPENVDTKAAAAVLLQGLTALTFAREAYEIKKGDTILIYSAAGGVGIFLTQIALAVGATVIATVSSDEKAKIVKNLGAQHVIISTQQNTVDEVLKITQGRGVQGIFDGTGKDTFEDNFKIAARKGTIVSLGNASEAVPPFAPLKLAEKNLKLCRPRLHNYIFTPEEHRFYADELFSLINTGVARPIYHKEYPFSAEGIQQTQKDISSRGTIGKLIVKIA